jgi:hypothetical protein
MGPETRKLLRRVARRQAVAAAASSCYGFLLLLCAVYVAFLLCARLLAVVPDRFAPVHVPMIAAAAALLGLVFRKRSETKWAARAIDTRMVTDDLFLTAVTIAASAGDYKPLVLRKAEGKAPSVQARQVVALRWFPRVRTAALILGGVLLAGLYLPQLDPFGREEERRRQAEEQKELADSRKATQLRLAALEAQTPEGELSAAVEDALKRLMQDFNAMKPTDREGNLRRLSERQAELGRMWRKAGERRVADALRQSFEAQQFGASSGRKSAQWKRELRDGRTDSMREQIEELRKAAEKLASMPKGEERQALKRQIEQSLAAMADFACNNLNSPGLNAALERAMMQLSMADAENLSADALQALQGSLDLTDAELASLAQSLCDLKALEKALDAANLAKMLNEMELLDGEACCKGNCKCMGDYAALYRSMMACQGECAGRGPGTGGEGTGEGSKAPEKPGLQTDYQSELSRSALTAGKILLSMKTQGLGESGEAEVAYRESLTTVQQSVSEAILHEQIPPAYQDSIRKYFDAMGEEGGAAWPD